MTTYNGYIDKIIDSSISTQRIRKASKVFPRRLQKTVLISTLVLNDTLMIALACGVAYWLRFTLYLPVFQLDVIPSIDYYQQLTLFFIPISLDRKPVRPLDSKILIPEYSKTLVKLVF